MVRKRIMVRVLSGVYLVSLVIFLMYLLIGYANSNVADNYAQVSSTLGSKSVNVSKVQFRQEYEDLIYGESKGSSSSVSGEGTAGDITKNETDTTLGSAKFLWPVPGFYTISSPFGQREQVAGTSINTITHNGLDITGVNIMGAPILAVMDGVVIKACVLNTPSADQYSASYGNYVEIEHANGLHTIYAHCSRVCVSKGGVVKGGQQIASVGNTGQSAGAHLHLAVQNSTGSFQDPASYLGLTQ